MRVTARNPLDGWAIDRLHTHGKFKRVVSFAGPRPGSWTKRVHPFGD